MSLSDLHQTDGTVILPPAHQTAPSATSGALTQGQTADSAATGKGNPDSRAGGNGAGERANGSTAAGKDNAGNHAAGNGAGEGSSGDSKAKSGIAQGSGAATGTGNQSTVEHISLPKNGQFGAVVLGTSIESRYPETAELWSGRLAYTVYLHVGLAKSWIMQYNISRSADAAASGSIAHIEAPWPYNIVRPNLAAGEIDADALMVHGFVNQDGRFETLSVISPPEFAQMKFVLNSLSQWQFRPATQNGKNITVEVLLIIPEQEE
jgi:hypothetical protein